MKLKNIEPMVLEILQRSEEARKDDFKLYYFVLRMCKVNTKISVEQFFWNMNKVAKAYNVPSFKSIERIRRKVQGDYPELKDKETDTARINEQAEYIRYNNS